MKQLRTIAENTIGLVDAMEEIESCELINEIDAAIFPSVKLYAEEIIASMDNLEYGWVFLGDIEIFLVRVSEGKYLPSVSSPEWEAKANCIDPELAVGAIDALAWVLSESIAYKLAEELANEL